MTTPDFNDLTPPNDLMDAWCKRTPSDGHLQAARWGARHGYDQARQLSLQEQAIANLDVHVITGKPLDTHLIRRALEQAGEGVE